MWIRRWAWLLELSCQEPKLSFFWILSRPSLLDTWTNWRYFVPPHLSSCVCVVCFVLSVACLLLSVSDILPTSYLQFCYACQSFANASVNHLKHVNSYESGWTRLIPCYFCRWMVLLSDEGAVVMWVEEGDILARCWWWGLMVFDAVYYRVLKRMNWHL